MKTLTIVSKPLLSNDNYAMSEELYEILARIVEEEVDWEMERILLLESGWSLVTISKNGKNFEDVRTWCEENLKGYYKSRYGEWVFEKQEDASWFLLRWS